MPYIPPETVSKAREMDLLTYLRNYEPEELVHFGGSTYCTREHDSLKISNGKWCWFSRGIGGTSALDYLIKVKDVPFLEAVERITGQAAVQPPVFVSKTKQEVPKVLLLPEAGQNNDRVKKYLAGRGIDRELIDFCVQSGRLYESEPYHNAVFIGLDNGQEVASMDDSKKALLKDIFWQMNEISSRSETAMDTVVTETDDGDGHIVQTTTTTNRTTLYIHVSHKAADEMADYFHFNADQRKQLAELLAEGNRSMWSAVLYGIGTGDGEIVTAALSQLGNVGGQPYWSWYGFGSRVEWCACFVSWCANECGYIDAGVIPKFAGCGTGVQWFKDRGLWQDRNYEPRPGDIIFFDWNDEYGQDGDSDHVGIVEKVEGGVVYTIEGNSGDICKENRYTVGYFEIMGYGTPAY